MHGFRCFFRARAGSTTIPPISAGFDLIPVAYARHPGQAIPLVGSWFGEACDFLGMSISVAVRKLGDIEDPSEG